MAETMVLARSTAATRDLKPGEYLATPGDPARHCVVRCPVCKQLTYVPRSFHVSVWGEVTPEVACPNARCSFIRLLTLADWVPEAKGSA